MYSILGTKELEFDSITAFNLWKEQEEQWAHTFYTKGKEYRSLPTSEATLNTTKKKCLLSGLNSALCIHFIHISTVNKTTCRLP